MQTQARHRFAERVASLREVQGDRGVGARARSALAAHAQALIEQGHADGAEVVLRALVRLEPESGYLWTCLGAVSVQLERWEEAIDALRRAVELDARSTAAASHLGEALLQSDDPTARRVLQRAADLDGSGSDRFANRARMLLAGQANGGRVASLESEG